jgi:hypothetical protein
MQLGFTAKECRMALRACKKDAEQAALKLLQRKEDLVREKAETRRKEIERRELYRYGRTADGKPVDATLVRGMLLRRSPTLTVLGAGLTGMGFPERNVVAALQQVNNNQAAAINILTDPSLVAASLARSAENNESSDDEAEDEEDESEDMEAELTRLPGYVGLVWILLPLPVLSLLVPPFGVDP